MKELRVYLANGEDFRVLHVGTQAECEAERAKRIAEHDEALHGRFKVEAK